MKVAALLAASIALSVAADPFGNRPAGEDGERLDYDRDVRPILADRCFSCHGPDGAQRKAGLRLDVPVEATDGADDAVRAIVPGDPASSELVRRITSADEDELMPPPRFKRPLTPDQRAILVRWIEEGAQHQPHWAFVAPRKELPPDVRATGWVRDPIDAYVLAALERRGLAPEPPADPRVLLRRAALVLTGLPPDVEDADAFAADPSDEAYARRVDALLASPRAAEHMATAWLDLARYADTHGFQTDGLSFAWPWRDWLLGALRDDMPYDRFVTAIVAGDHATAASVADLVATGFHRLHRLTEEGGSIPEEFRQEGIADRVGTFGTTFLGLTLECARCHDHKYDPVPTREFYALAAMFGGIDENGLKPHSLQVSATPPFVRLATAEQDARTAQLRERVAAARQALDRVRAAAAERFDAAPVDAGAAEPPAPVAHHPFEELANGATPDAVAGGTPATTDRRRPEQLGAVALVEGRTGRALSFDGDGGILLAGHTGFGRHDPASFALWIRPGERNARAAIVHASGFHTQEADASGLELEIEDGRVRWSAIHLWPGSAASVRTREPLRVGAWTHLVATWDGSSRAEGLRLYVDGVPAATDVVRDALDGPLAGNALEVGSRSRGSGFRGGALDELRLWRLALTELEAHQLAVADGVELQRSLTHDVRRAHAVERVDPSVRSAREDLRAAQRELAAHLDAIPAFACMADSPWAPPTHVLVRGAYDHPDTTRVVEPGAIEAVLPFGPDLPRNRAGLARWMLDARNPLVSRVAVNRLWMQVFGSGLVETPENFGVQGSSPTNAALLDSLAHDFVHGDGSPASAWRVKRLLKRMVTSSTFRQSSAATAAKHAADPPNQLLSRGPSARLTAEMLRDSALHASGLLVESFGGPSVKPWQPPGIWAEAGQTGDYQPDSGPGAHRRSLYTLRKRTVPVPNLAAFDAGQREACQPRRHATNTPLQSLVLFNDPVFLECARALARRATAETEGIDARIERAFRLACTRLPTAEELAALRDLVASRTRRRSEASGAGDAGADGDDPALAALVLACSTILASDGALVVR